MEFRILGDLEVQVGAERLALGGPRDRKVLAMLLLGDGRGLPVTRLIDALWDQDPPATAAKQVQNAVSRLRHLLAGAGAPRAVVAEGASYRLALDDATLDARRFVARVGQARAAASAGRAADAAAMLRSALDLWRGPALAGLDGAVIGAAATGWNERRSAAQAMYLDQQLALGRHHEVLGELAELAAADPWREGTTGQLMLALYRCGRQSEALDRYLGTQELLRTAGLNPGPALRELHQQILNHDPTLVAPRPPPPGGGHRVPDAGVPGSVPWSPPAKPEALVPPTAAAGGSGVDVFTVVIGHYADAELPDLDVQARVGRLVDVLAAFGGCHRPWRHPDRGRGADAVQRRLREWPVSLATAGGAGVLAGEAVNPVAGSSVLYWVGHGWCDGDRAALAHAESPAAVGGWGVEPHQLAQAIRARQAAADGVGGWALVVVEAGHAAEIADAVMALLHGPGAPGRLLLVAVPGDGAVPPGGFAGVLAGLLAGAFRADGRVLLRDLAAELERLLGPGCVHQRALGEAALVRVYPSAAAWMSAPVDTIVHLEEVLADLSPDERGHFLVKAQGAEHGELSWFFEGREGELARIGAWLHQAASGMLVVTGRAGSGKSALLGTVLVRSVPALRDALVRRGLVAAPGPGVAAPPESVFDAVVHLSGLDLAQATARVADAAGIGPLPSRTSGDAGLAGDLDFLAGELARRARRFTVLADAVDESVDPLDIARSLLARIAVLPGVRVLAGTRASTREAPDAPAEDEDLLDALTAGTGCSAQSQAGAGGDHGWVLVRVGPDRQAVGRYVRNRLRAAREHGVAGRPVPYLAQVSDQDIDRAAAEVAAAGREFLFARLAVFELIADARLLTPGKAASRGRLLSGGHQDLFARAVDRLASHDDRYPVLLQALSLARGRGIPAADGIWTAIAAALTPGPGSAVAAGPADAGWAEAVSGLLWHAAAYVAVDTSSTSLPAALGSVGPDCSGAQDRRAVQSCSQTVYRLAHQTFVEYFARHPPAEPGGGDPRRLAADGLLRAAARAAGAGSRGLPGYLAGHLSGHVAEAGMWDDLAGLPRVLDRLDPGAVTTDAIRTLFGRRLVPPPIAGIIGARDTLAAARPADRPGLRQLATAIYSSRHVIGEPAAGWGIAAARAGHCTVHVRLSGHVGTVNRVRGLMLPGGRTALASCADDGTIRLWDPVTATPIGVPMTGHDGTVEDICTLPAPDGRTLLASAGGDGTVRLWDPATGQPAAPPITGHAGPVWAVCAVPGCRPGQSPALASAGADGTVRLWDPATGQPAAPPLTGHAGTVWAVCAVPGRRPGQPPGLVSAGADGTVRLWDLGTGQSAAPPLTGHVGPAFDVCVVPGRQPGQPPGLVSAGADGTVRLWDLGTGQSAAPPLTGHVGPAFDVCVVPGRQPGQPQGLVSAGADGTVRLWDLGTGQSAAPPLTGHVGPVYDVCVVPGRRPGEPPGLASGGADGTVRWWDLGTGQSAAPPLTGHVGPVYDVCVVPGRQPGQPPGLASAGADGTVRLWDPATGQSAAPPPTGHVGPVHGVCVVPGRQPGQPPALASAGEDGTVRLWDPATSQPAAPPIIGHVGPVYGVCVVPGRQPGQPPALATAGYDGTVRLWDPATGQPAAPPITGHAGPLWGVCVVPGRQPGEPPGLASAGADGTVRLWDPGTGQPAAPPITGHTGTVYSVCVVPGQPPALATAGNDGTVRLWDPGTGQPAAPPITGHAGPVLGVCVVPGQLPALASAGVDGTVRLWDPGTGQPAVPPITGHAGPVYGVCVLPGRQPGLPPALVTAGNDGTVRLWDPGTGQPAAPPITSHTGPVVGVCVVPGRQPGLPPALATAGNDGTVRLWDPATGRAIGEPLARTPEAVSGLAPGAAPAGCVAVHGDGAVRTWIAATAALCAVTAPPDVSAIATLISADHIRLVAGDIYGRVHLTDLCTGRHPGSVLRVGDRAVLALCPLPGPHPAARVGAAGGSGAITFITISPGGRLEPGPVLGGCSGPIRALCVATGRDGRQLLAAAGNDGAIWAWDLAAIDASAPSASPPAPVTGPLTGHDGWIWSLAAIPAESGLPPRLASAGADHTVRLWDLASGRAASQPLTGHTDQVRAVITATSDDGRLLLVSGGHDGTIRLWDPATGSRGAVIPLGIPVHALLAQQPDPASRQRTSGGATITAGLRTGILTLDLHRDLFRSARAAQPRAPSAPDRRAS